MEATLRAGILKSLLDCTKDLWTSANFLFDADGLRMRAMDNSHIALACLTLRPGVSAIFSSFQCSEQVKLGIQFDALSMALKACAVDDELKLEYNVGNDYITIVRGDDLRQWELKLLDIEEDEMIIPDQKYNVSAEVPSSDFLKMCRDLKDIGGETISIRVDDGSKISCSVEGVHGRGTAVLKEGISVECARETACSYGLRFIHSFAKASPLCLTVRVQLGKETPLCITYDIEAGHGSPDSQSNLQFFLASRIDEGDD